MKRRRLLGKQSGYILYTITTVNKKYGDNSFINPLSISGDGTVTYTSSNTAAATIDSSTGEVTIIAPGTSTITATTNDTLDYIYDVKNASYTLIVAKADGNVSENPVAQSIVYDGDPHNLVSAGSGTGTMMYKLGNDGEWDTIIPSATNAGEYIVYYKSSETAYYTESNIGSVNITILKASPTYTAPTATSLIYNTNALNLLNVGSTNDGLIEYSNDGTTWSTTIPLGTNAGLYTSYWKLTGDSNHSNISSTSIITIIDKVTPTVIPPIGLTVSYDGESHQLITPGSTNYGTLKYSLDNITYSTSIPTASVLDSYTVYYKVDGDSNIYDVAYSTVQASIGGITVLNPTIELEYNSCNYDGTAKIPSVVVKDDEGEIISSDEYIVSYSNNTDAGTATVTITDVSGGTYIINGSATFTINPINPTYTAPTAKTGLVYNCSSQLLLNSGSVTSGGTMYYSSDGINWSENNTYSGSNAGIYNTYWKIVKANNNYNDIESTSIETTISKCTPSIVTPTAKTLTYNTSTQILANAGSISGSCSSCASLEYSLDNSTWSSSVPSATNAGSYIVYYRVPGDSNINEVTGNIECTISTKVPSSITVELSQSTYTYDGSAKTPTVTVKDGSDIIPSSEYTVTYTNNTNAGTATITITDKSGGNYSFETQTVNFTINKASISPVVTMDGWVYGGTPTDPSITGNSGNGTVTYYYKVNSADDSTYTGTKPGSTSTATTYKVKAVVEETTNYLGTTVYTTFDISKTSGSVTISGRTLTYNGNSQNLVTVSEATGTMYYRVGTSGEWSTDIPTITNKTSSSNTDSWTIYYYIDASTNYNGCGSSSTPCGNVTTTMEKVTPTITAPTAKSAQAYTGSALALANAGSTNYGTLQYSLDHSNWETSIPTAINNGTYLVYYRVVGDNNIYDMSKESPYYYTISSTSSIVEKTVTATIIPEYNSVEYDKTAKTPSVTVKDGDTIIPSSEYTVSYSNNTNAGTATITITDNTGGNYAVTGSTTFTITQKEVCLTWGTLSWTYNGSAHSTTCTVGCLISGDSCSATLSGNSITNKGTTTVTATGLSNSNYKLPSSGTSKTLTISARPINITAGSNSKTYDGTALTYNSASAESTGTNRGLVSGHSMTSCTVSGSITNKGSVNNVPSSAVIKNSGGTDVTSNYSISYVNGTLTINARTVTVTAGSTSKTYDGSALSYNNASASNLASGHTLSSYSCSGSITNKGSANNVPSAAVIKSGSTDVTSNYSVSYTNGTLTINARPINITAGTTSKTYDGTALTYNSATAESTGTNRGLVSGHSMTSCTVSGSITTKGSTNNVPSGAVIKSGSTDVTSNYSINYVNGTLTINARSVTYKATDESWAYDGNTHSASNTATLTSGSLASGHSATFSCSGSVGAGVGSATKTLSSVTIKNSGGTNVSSNYSITRNNGTLTINAKSISIPTPTNYSGTYNESAHTATFGSATGASITKYRYSTNNSSWTESTSNPSLTNVGTLYTLAYYTASTNYTGSNWSSSATITISRAKTASASAANKTYNGTTESNGTAQTGVSGSYVSWSGTTSATNAGSYTAYATPDSNHAWSDGTTALKTISWTMSRRGQTAPVLNGDSKTFHNTATASIKTAGTVSGSTAAAPGTLTWSNLSRTAVGSLTASAFYAATATNFSASLAGTATVEITKASDASVTVTRTNRTYNESSLTIASIASTHGCSNYSIGLGSSSSSAPSSWSSSLSATSCGTYYVWKKWTADSNHSNSSSGVYDGSVSIAKSSNYTITATPTATNPTYNGNALYLLTGGSASISGTFSYSSSTNVGTYTGTWTFTPSNSCYESKSGTVSNCKINAKAITVTGTSNSKTYDGTAVSVAANSASITSGSLVSGHTITYSTSGASQTIAGSSTNTVNSATIKNSGGTDVTSNYSITKVNGYATITTRAITAKAGGGTWTYDGNAHSNTTGGSITSGSLPSNHTITYSCSGSITNAGSVTNTLSSVVIKNSGGTDVTSSFSVTKQNNTLTVNKATPVTNLVVQQTTYPTTAYVYFYSNVAGTVYETWNGTQLTSSNYSSSSLINKSVTAGNGSSTNPCQVDSSGSACDRYWTIYTYFVPTNSNYESVASGPKTLSISKASANSGSVSNPGAVSFSTSSQTVQLGISGASGTITYPTSITVKNSSNSTVSGWSCTSAGVVTIPASTTVGSYTVTGNISIASATCYNSGTASKSWVVTINRASRTISLSRYPSGEEYTEACGLPTDLSVTYPGDGTVTYSISSEASSYLEDGYTFHPGSRAETITITASVSQTTNWNSAQTTKSITITNKYNCRSYVDLGFSTKWATYNVGASSQTSVGTYFKYGLTSAFSTSQANYSGQMSSTLGSSYDAARANMGGQWHIPTQSDWNTLISNTTLSFTTISGVKGMKFTSKTNSNYIFIPVGGYYTSSGRLSDSSTQCRYWTSTPSSSTKAANFICSTSTPKIQDQDISNGLLVRACC